MDGVRLQGVFQATRLKIEKCEVRLPGRKVRKDRRMLIYDLESSYLCRGFYAQLAFLERNRLATASREVLSLLVKGSNSVRSLPGRKVRKDRRMSRYDVESSYPYRGIYA